MSLIVEKIRAAIPACCAILPYNTEDCSFSSTFTEPSFSNSATMAGKVLVSSSDNETLTSEVVTTSTAVRCLSNTSNNARKNPYARAFCEVT